MMDKKPTVYVTKYALSAGIIKFGGDQYKVNADHGHHLSPTGGDYRYSYFSLKEWFTDKGAAVKDANARRDRKIASLQKQIDKLKRLDFGAE